MDEEKIGASDPVEPKNRRDFVKGAAKVGLAAPAAVLLLNASAKPTKAQPVYGIVTLPGGHTSNFP